MYIFSKLKHYVFRCYFLKYLGMSRDYEFPIRRKHERHQKFLIQPKKPSLIVVIGIVRRGCMTYDARALESGNFDG